MSAAAQRRISRAAKEDDAQALAIRTNRPRLHTARQGFVSLAAGFSLRRLRICGFAFAASHLRLRICGFAFAASHLRLRICGFAFAASHLRLRICGFAFAASHLRLRICGFAFAASHLRLRICGFRICGFAFAARHFRLTTSSPRFLVARRLTKLLQFREMRSCKIQKRLRPAVVIVALVSLALCGRVAARVSSLLPTQQRVKVRGKDVPLGLFPSGMALSSDGRLIVASNNGFLSQSLTAVDTETLKTKDTRVGNSTGSDVVFIGVALSPDGRTVYASGHDDFGNDVIHTATIAPGPQLTFGARIALTKGSFPAGMAMSPDG